MIVVAGCSATADPANSATATFDPALGCDGLADRWIRLQQSFLDQLADATAAELATGSERIDAANRFLGGALIEQARDASAVGCDVEVSSGAPALCERIDALEAGGEAGAAVIDQLERDCHADDR